VSLDEPGGPLESQWERPAPLAGLVAIRLAKDRCLGFDLGGTDEVSQNTSDRSGCSVARTSARGYCRAAVRLFERVSRLLRHACRCAEGVSECGPAFVEDGDVVSVGKCPGADLLKADA
jgi:hypothetical protein